MSISDDSLSDETLNRGPWRFSWSDSMNFPYGLVQCHFHFLFGSGGLWFDPRQYEFPLRINTVPHSLFSFSFSFSLSESLWFSAIQQYMGDLAVKQELSDLELVNEFIIDPARRNKYLRDEVYCQIIKQLTNNPDRWVLSYWHHTLLFFYKP